MRFEPSKLAQLVVPYRGKFGRYLPSPALRLVDAGDSAAILQDSLATGVPLSEKGWGWVSPIKFSPRGCIVREENPERVMTTKGPDGEWLLRFSGADRYGEETAQPMATLGVSDRERCWK